LLGFGPYCKVLPNIYSLYGVGYLQKYTSLVMLHMSGSRRILCGISNVRALIMREEEMRK